MWYQVGVLFVVIAFLIYLAAAFGTSVGALLINGLIIFLIVYRSYFEIKAGRKESHLVGAGVALFVLLFFENIGKPFWVITTFVIIAYITAVIIQIMHKKDIVKHISRGRLAKHKA